MGSLNLILPGKSKTAWAFRFSFAGQPACNPRLHAHAGTLWRQTACRSGCDPRSKRRLSYSIRQHFHSICFSTMPHNLDETTQKIILTVSTFTTAVIAVPALIGQFRLVPNLKRRLAAQSDEKKRPSLLLGCLGFLVLMFSATVILTSPILYLEHQQDDELAAVEQSSSINFCEEDFRHTPYIAEPANVISSLTCYVPLALLGLFGPPSTQYKREKRFITIYATLVSHWTGIRRSSRSSYS